MTNAPGDDGMADHRHHLDRSCTSRRRTPQQQGRVRLLQVGAGERPARPKALDYVPLPAALVKQIEAYWAAEFKH